MSELTVTLLRVGYLALLWALVLFSIGVLRRDLYGTKIVDRRRPAQTHQGGGASAGAAAGGAAGAGVAGGPDAAGTAKGRRTSDPTRLVVTEGPLRGTTLPLGASGILIGRAPSCTLVLDDDYSSSRHARIFPQSGQWFVEDLGSTNGTFLGNQRVAQPTPLPVGTPVRVGQSVLELQR